jgi:predicted glycosyltransferase involved in capsule biosynthesis
MLKKDITKERCETAQIDERRFHEMKTHNLETVTFMIPVCIESDDRLRNAKTVLGYLNHHFKTNVIIHELTNGDSKLQFLDLFKNLEIKHIIEQSDLKLYHRTRQINEMLNLVSTPIVVNYDIDVVLPIDTYIEAKKLISDMEYDVVYPYGDGMYQKMVSTSFNRNIFHEKYDLNLITNDDFILWNAKYGHCIFLNTKKYKNAGGENELFIGYGPEDVERYERFMKLDYKIIRINNLVYHFEHLRTNFSDSTNEYFSNNNNIYNSLSVLNKQEIIQYYNNIEYIKKI